MIDTKNLGDIKDIFQELELDYPELEISFKSEVYIHQPPRSGSKPDEVCIYGCQKHCGCNSTSPRCAGTEIEIHLISITNIKSFDAHFADDLCAYANKCFDFGFESLNYLKIDGILIFPKGILFASEFDAKKHVPFKDWICFKSGEDLIAGLISNNKDHPVISDASSITLYFYRSPRPLVNPFLHHLFAENCTT